MVDHYLRRAWKQSTDVAALSAMIGKTSTTLEADSALLAGLTHSTGLSPILVKAENYPDILGNAQQSVEEINMTGGVIEVEEIREATVI